MLPRPRLSACGLLLCPLLAACEGQLIVDLAAAPVDGAGYVRLAIPSVELLGSDGSATSLTPDDTSRFDLLGYTDGSTRRLIDVDADVDGSYIGLRLRFDDGDPVVVTDSGASVPIELLSAGEYAGLSLELDSTSSATLVAVLDLRFSLIDRIDDLGSYQMIPVLRVVDGATAGAIEGTVADALVRDADCRNGRGAGAGVAVYLYAGTDVTPRDYYDSGSIVNLVQPLASSAVALDSDGSWRFLLPHVAPGDYTVAWTCEGDGENPRTDDELTFRASVSVSVAETQTSTVSFSSQ